ncbi:MAG: type II secretion system protein GspM [Desulfobacterales bacterium]
MQITRERKYILIIGAVLLACGLVYRFYPALSGFFSVADQAAVKQAQIKKFQSETARKKSLQKQKSILQKRLKKLEGSLLKGTTPSLAAVDLQDFIKKIAEAHEIEISSTRVLNVETEADEAKYALIPVRFSITAGVREFKNLLYEIEAAPRLLIVTDLSVDTLHSQKPGKIRAHVTVAGVMPHAPESG